MIRSIVYCHAGKLAEAKLSQLSSAMEKAPFVWIDVENPSYNDFGSLEKRFNLHKLAVENAVVRNQRPKSQSFPDHLLLVMHAVEYNKCLHINELDFFLGKNFVITVHYKKLDAIGYARRLYEREPGLFSRGPDFLVYNIFDRLVDNYFTVLESIDEKLDRIEDSVFKSPKPRIINDLFNMKKEILNLHKTVAPQAEVVNTLIRRELQFVKPETIVYFRDIYDHIIRIVSIIDTQREIATGALEAYLSVVSNKMNEVMKVLTVIATIMLPLTLISSIYGMNFQYMPELSSPYGYFATLGLMLVVAVIMLIFFRRKKWI